MPKINDLTNRPGGPQPTDEIWLASAGAAADFKATITALASAVLGHIDVEENNNGVSVRFPTSRFHVCYQRDASISADANGNWTWTLPRGFASVDSYVFWASERVSDYVVKEYRPGSTPNSVRVRVYTDTGNLRPGAAVGDLMAIGLY